MAAKYRVEKTLVDILVNVYDSIIEKEDYSFEYKEYCTVDDLDNDTPDCVDVGTRNLRQMLMNVSTHCMDCVCVELFVNGKFLYHYDANDYAYFYEDGLIELGVDLNMIHEYKEIVAD